MESPNKRQKQSPPAAQAEDDFVPFGGDDEGADSYGFSNGYTQQPEAGLSHPPREPRAMLQRGGQHGRGPKFDRLNAKDRPKSKHALPGYEPWVLVKTKLGRRFAHNLESKESFWWIPKDVMLGVVEFEAWEKGQNEKNANAKWAEEQLRAERQAKVEAEAQSTGDEGRSRRQRSESLQREDEEAMMAELAAQEEHAEEKDAKAAVKAVEHNEPQTGYASDSSYEEVEVTDSEGEEDGEPGEQDTRGEGQDAPAEEEGPVEFGEDDIAYQLAAMGEDYGLEPEEYGDMQPEEGEEDQGMELTEEDALNLFREMLSDHQISPYTPWEKLLTDESPESILNDDRYTILGSSKARKEAWQVWAKDTAAQLKEARAQMAKRNPIVPYLDFLATHATPKLYWPEFKRKFKKDSVMNDRHLSEKERERLYRAHISRLKLPETTRKADLLTLLNTLPTRTLNKQTSLDALPEELQAHVHFISLPAALREEVLLRHISTLPQPPSDGGTEEEETAAEKKYKQAEKGEKALEERERRVREEKRKAEVEGRLARKDLMEGQREVRDAMNVRSKGLADHLGDGAK